MFKRTIPFVLFLSVTAASRLSAQCSMCKATVESNLTNGGNTGGGINSGIIYMLVLVYVVLMTGAYFFFRRQIHEKIRGIRSKYFPQKI